MNLRAKELEILLHGSMQICRAVLAEASRFPEASTLYFDVAFAAVHERLRTYVQAMFGLTTEASTDAVEKILGRIR